MATVRITEQIRREVRRKIEALFDARIKKKLEELQHLDVAMQVFMRLVTPEEFAAAQKLNTDVKWVPEISTLNVRIVYTDIDGVNETAAFNVSFKPPVPAPQSFHGYIPSNEKNLVHPSLPCYQPCVDVILEHARMVKERDTLRDSIDNLLKSCGTLRQVLEKWPTALDFMSDEVKARHAQKVDPIRKEVKKEVKVIAEVDDQAKMLLMKARILNGT